jgi:hypothetical protein
VRSVDADGLEIDPAGGDETAGRNRVFMVLILHFM